MIINEAYQIDDKEVKHKMIPIEVLQEIRQEITDLNRYQFSGFGIDAYLNAGEVYKIIDTKIKELSE